MNIVHRMSLMHNHHAFLFVEQKRFDNQDNGHHDVSNQKGEKMCDFFLLENKKYQIHN